METARIFASSDNIVPFFLENFQVIRWDHRGHGQSDKPISEDSEELLNLYSIKSISHGYFRINQCFISK